MSGSAQLLREFAEKSQTPVTLTLLGKGAMPEDHPLVVGMMGMHGEAASNLAIQEADHALYRAKNAGRNRTIFAEPLAGSDAGKDIDLWVR